MSYDKVGDVQMAQGNLPEALKSYRDSLAIRERLAKSDPQQHGLATRSRRELFKARRTYIVVSNDRGDVLAALRQGQAIMDRLTKLWPDNADWKNELAWFENQIAASTK